MFKITRSHIGMLLAVATFQTYAAPEITPSAIPQNLNAVERFYPTQLTSTPAGTIEDREVWLAKINGLMVDAPASLQNSLVGAQNQRQFERSLALLEQMQSGELNRQGLERRKATAAGADLAKVIGDTSNLVYKSLTPCRMFDSRSATAAGFPNGAKLSGNVEYNVPGYTSGTYAAYGGAASNCGIAVTGNVYALAIVVTVLAPNFDAYIGVDGSGNLATTLSNVALNFTRGQGASTSYIVNQSSNNSVYFAMPSGLSAHVIVDVLGYFIVSDATPLDCQTILSTPIPVAAGAFVPYQSITCPTGFSPVSGSFVNTSSSEVFLADNGPTTNGWYMYLKNLGGSSTTVTPRVTCCRIPGRL
jgi:hypothetical protein